MKGRQKSNAGIHHGRLSYRPVLGNPTAGGRNKRKKRYGENVRKKSEKKN